MYKIVFITMHSYTKVNALQQHAALHSLLVTKTALLVYCSNLPVLSNTSLVTAPTQFFANLYIYIYLFIYTQSIRLLLNVEQFWFFGMLNHVSRHN